MDVRAGAERRARRRRAVGRPAGCRAGDPGRRRGPGAARRASGALAGRGTGPAAARRSRRAPGRAPGARTRRPRPRAPAGCRPAAPRRPRPASGRSRAVVSPRSALISPAAAADDRAHAARRARARGAAHAGPVAVGASRSHDSHTLLRRSIRRVRSRSAFGRPRGPDRGVLPQRAETRRACADAVGPPVTPGRSGAKAPPGVTRSSGFSAVRLRAPARCHRNRFEQENIMKAAFAVLAALLLVLAVGDDGSDGDDPSAGGRTGHAGGGTVEQQQPEGDVRRHVDADRADQLQHPRPGPEPGQRRLREPVERLDRGIRRGQPEHDRPVDRAAAVRRG